ncbi:hypothetical protein [Polyangium sp. 15x6]|uniref:hypothetical protein n=1 Tax=Polyangium sp. 15x6 TaxID=3042687 RepID=UPI00249AED4D|nr:hypothetical protein [Polyangium sp. 15x6]MDI3282129.1 hypothetical protein [Polyangium sp. 15x6]
MAELWELAPAGTEKQDEDGKYNHKARDRIRIFLKRLQDEHGVQILHKVGRKKWYYDPHALALVLPDIAAEPYSEEIRALKARIHQLESRLARLERAVA